MTPTQKRKRFGTLLLILCVGALTSGARGQIQEQSPSELVKFLTHPPQIDTLLGCGVFSKYRSAAVHLAKLGDSALPEIELALDSLSAQGRQSEFATNAGWLLFAYARVRGSAAYDRLRKMSRSSSLSFLQLDFDNAIALSLHLTSYVSSSTPLTRILDCSHPLEPRLALNQLLLAWEKNDRYWLESSLGPSATVTLNSLLKGRSWEELRSELWRNETGAGIAVGYRFLTPGRWSEPEETLDEGRSRGNTGLSAVNPEVETLFTNRSGDACGKYRIKFLQTAGRGKTAHLPYVVDNSDLGDLLRLIAACGADAREGH